MVRKCVLTIVTMTAALAIAPPAQAGYIEVFGSPTYDANTQTGFKDGQMPRNPGSCVNDAGTAVGSAYKYVATQRLAYIASLEEAAKEQRDLQRRLEQIDKQYEEKIARIRQRATPTIYLAKGTVKKYAVTYVPPATHKLVVEDRITFLLYSSKLDLTQYEGKFVGVAGNLERARAFAASIIHVKKIDVLSSE